MTRSKINQLLKEAAGFFQDDCALRLPDFAFYAPGVWRTLGPEADEIRRCELGWEVLQFGGDFDQLGCVALTLRNGVPSAPVEGRAYSERFVYLREGQAVPFYYHRTRGKDLVNRGCGGLTVELYKATPDGAFDAAPVFTRVDGVAVELPPGGLLELEPGESVYVPAGTYHRFADKAGRGASLAVEIGGVDLGLADMRFADAADEPTAFDIDEDEAPVTHLRHEYPAA